jgi:murein DD-endopeptidase MepM/ murein hydrolase activator NlpD
MKKIKLCIVTSILLFSLISIIEVQAASVSIHTNRTKIATGEEVTVSGVIMPRHRKITVTILGANSINGKYTKITTDKTNRRGKYSAVISPATTKYIKVSYLRNGKKIVSNKELITVSDELSIITPYINEDDIISVNEAYSMSDDAPWGFTHPGVDFSTEYTIPIQAVTDGVICNVATTNEHGNMGWRTAFCITYGDYAPCYSLETFSEDESIGEEQTASVLVENDQVVKQGDIVANLVYGGSGAHIDFGIGHDNTRICPEPYFTEEAQESVMYLITKDHPDWPMCYEE